MPSTIGHLFYKPVSQTSFFVYGAEQPPHKNHVHTDRAAQVGHFFFPFPSDLSEQFPASVVANLAACFLQVDELVGVLNGSSITSNAEVVVAPPAVYLQGVSQKIRSDVKVRKYNRY